MRLGEDCKLRTYDTLPNGFLLGTGLAHVRIMSHILYEDTGIQLINDKCTFTLCKILVNQCHGEQLL